MPGSVPFSFHVPLTGDHCTPQLLTLLFFMEKSKPVQITIRSISKTVSFLMFCAICASASAADGTSYRIRSEFGMEATGTQGFKVGEFLFNCQNNRGEVVDNFGFVTTLQNNAADYQNKKSPN